MLRNIKRIRKSLIALDVILVIVAMTFLFDYLLFPQSVNLSIDLPTQDVQVPTKQANEIDPKHYTVISEFPQPLIIRNPKRKDENKNDQYPPLSALVRVDGTMPEEDPKAGSAFLFIIPKNIGVVGFAGEEFLLVTPKNQGNLAFFTEEIIDKSKLSAIKVEEVYLDKVVFSYNGKREILQAPAVGNVRCKLGK